MSSSRARRPVAVFPLLLLLLLLVLSSCSVVASCCTEPRAAAGGNINRPARRLLLSPPSTSRQKAEQEMRVGRAKMPVKHRQAAASVGRKKIPRSGWNPIQNR